MYNLMTAQIHIQARKIVFVSEQIESLTSTMKVLSSNTLYDKALLKSSLAAINIINDSLFAKQQELQQSLDDLNNMLTCNEH